VKLCKKNLESFSLNRRKNYRDPWRSLFVANFKNVSRTYESPGMKCGGNSEIRHSVLFCAFKYITGMSRKVCIMFIFKS
jgi:hypothetical protein